VSAKTERMIIRALGYGPGSAPDIAVRLGWGGWGRACAYPTLRSMVARGVLTVREEPGGPERGGRTRYVYSLSARRDEGERP
jgi:DNA-binding PadR family transcriptional regulator